MPTQPSSTDRKIATLEPRHYSDLRILPPEQDYSNSGAKLDLVNGAQDRAARSISTSSARAGRRTSVWSRSPSQCSASAKPKRRQLAPALDFGHISRLRVFLQKRSSLIKSLIVHTRSAIPSATAGVVYRFHGRGKLSCSAPVDRGQEHPANRLLPFCNPTARIRLGRESTRRAKDRRNA